MAELTLRLLGYVSLKSAALTRHESAGGTTILCEGASFVWGVGGRSFPEQLQERLQKAGPGRAFRVINKGVPGTNSAQMLATLPAHLKQYRPDALIILTGYNNTWNNAAAAVPTTEYPAFGERLWGWSYIYRLGRLLYKGRERTYKSPDSECALNNESWVYRQINADELAEAGPSINKTAAPECAEAWSPEKLTTQQKNKLSSIYKNKTNLLLKSGKAGEALCAAKAAFELAPYDADAAARLARLYSKFSLHEKALRTLKATEGYAASTALAPAYGEYYHANGDYALSAEYYSKALKTPQAASAFNYAGMIAAMTAAGQRRQAMSEVKKAEAIFPDSHELATLKLRLHAELRQYDQAAQLFDALKEKHRFQAYASYFGTMLRLGEYARAEKAASAPAQTPDVEPLLYLARTYSGAGMPSREEKMLRLALERSPENAEALVMLGNLKEAECEPGEAEALYGKAQASAPKYWGGYYAAGTLNLKRGNFKKAAELMGKALDCNPPDTLDPDLLGYYYREEQYTPQAGQPRAIGIIYPEESVPMLTPLAKTLLSRARAYAFGGETAKARTDYILVLEKEPASDRFHELAGLYKNQNEREGLLSLENRIPGIRTNPQYIAFKCSLRPDQSCLSQVKESGDGLKRDLSQAVMLARKAGVKAIILSSYPEHSPEPIAQAAQNAGAFYADIETAFRSVFRTRADYIARDNTHCNTAGYSEMAEVYAGLLAEPLGLKSEGRPPFGGRP
ncbi:MAG: hypothetical protein GX410_04185 [Elusimicrobia bacterium]|nr:hypothetical protein [Elusimicrobiota bacterium]